MWKKLYKEAEEVATLLHQYQSYDIFPYTKHLRDVVEILENHGYVNEYIVAGWLHDSMEDCNISYNKIRKVFGKDVAEMVYAVTDPKGRTRDQKKEKVYQDLRAYPKAIVIKVADRIANMRNCIRMNNRDKLRRYYQEGLTFRNELYPSSEIPSLWRTYDEIMTSLEQDFLDDKSNSNH